MTNRSLIPDLSSAEASRLIRSSAHASSPVTRPAQCFLDRVTDLEVARVMYHLEAGIRLKRGTYRWVAPAGHRLATGQRLSAIVGEMIRTGLVRDYRDPRTGEHTLIPAMVHLRDGEGSDAHSACLFAGEDLGPMRARLVDMEFLSLVDCLACEQAIATGRNRAL